MSEENVEIVRSNLEAAKRRDWDALFRNSHPDIELTTPPRGINAGTYRGREECQGYWEDLASAFETVSVEPERLVDSGDQVVAVMRSRLQPKGSSGEIELRTGFLWTFRDGKVASLRLFAKPEEALEAAGLSE
jgi:ketosteroid isomerase-like protein